MVSYNGGCFVAVDGRKGKHSHRIPSQLNACDSREHHTCFQYSSRVVDMSKNGSERENTNLFLHDSLRPLYQLTQRTGILFDWCVPVTSTWSATIIHLCVVTMAVLVVVITTLFQVLQSVLRTSFIKNIEKSALYLACILPLSYTCCGIWLFLHRRQELLDFFSRFHKLEKQIVSPIHAEEIQSQQYYSYVVYSIISAFSFVIPCSAIILSPQLPFFFTSDPFLSRVFNSLFLQIVQVSAFVLVSLYVMLIDLVPSFTYYHAGCLVESKGDRIICSAHSPLNDTNYTENKNKEDENPNFSWIQKSWTEYKELHGLIEWADSLFGSLILFGNGVKLVLICLFSCVALKYLANIVTINAVISIIILLDYFMRLAICMMLTNHLKGSRERLSSSIASFLDRRWFGLGLKQYRLLLAFEDRVKRDHSAISFCGILNAIPCICLTFVSVAISCAVMLFQN